MAGRTITWIQAVNEAIRQEMQRDPLVILMGEDIAGGAGKEKEGIVDAWGGPFGETKGLIKEFGPQRVLDTPISEAGYIGAGVGAAATGLRPIVDLMFVDFLGVCFDQIMNEAAKMRYMYGGKCSVPITIMTRTGAGIGSAAQHSQTTYSVFAHYPGLKCVAPSDPYTAKGLMIAAIRDNDPVVVFNNKRLFFDKGEVPEEAYAYPIGKARVMKAGKDITLVGISRMTSICMEAAAALAKDGIDAEVVDLLSLSPIDHETIVNSIKKTHRMVVVDEDNPMCSMASEIAAIAADEAFDYLDAPVKRVNAPHCPVPYSSVLEQAYVPSPEKVVAAVKSLLK